MLEVSPKTQAAIRDAAMRDLAPRAAVIQAKVALSLGVGGGLSLAFCGQFGVGLTPWAESLHRSVMQLSTFVPCMVLCGVIFALLPVATLRALCRPLEFRAIMRRRPFSMLGWLLAFELLLAWHSGFGVGGIGLAAWFGAAALTLWGLGLLIDGFASSGFGRLAKR